MLPFELEKLKHPESGNFFLIAGPCVVENEEVCLRTAEKLVKISDDLHLPYIFKSSYRKANRSRSDSFSGIGDARALSILRKTGEIFDIPVITDIHSAGEAAMAAEYVEILQIPAFLSRQTDILVAAAETGKCINIKKGQFMAPGMMKFAAGKVQQSGNRRIMLTDRGTMFGYQDLVVDFRGLVEMKSMGFPVVLDVTHALQRPNLPEGVSGGQPELIGTLSKAGVAAGADGLFLEIHPDPSSAKSDGPSMLPLDQAAFLLQKLVRLHQTVRTL